MEWLRNVTGNSQFPGQAGRSRFTETSSISSRFSNKLDSLQGTLSLSQIGQQTTTQQPGPVQRFALLRPSVPAALTCVMQRSHCRPTLILYSGSGPADFCPLACARRFVSRCLSNWLQDSCQVPGYTGSILAVVAPAPATSHKNLELWSRNGDSGTGSELASIQVPLQLRVTGSCQGRPDLQLQLVSLHSGTTCESRPAQHPSWLSDRRAQGKHTRDWCSLCATS